MFGPKKFLVQKNFWSKEIFWSIEMFDSKRILVQKLFWSQIIFGQKNFVSKIFGPKKYFCPTKFSGGWI